MRTVVPRRRLKRSPGALPAWSILDGNPQILQTRECIILLLEDAGE